MIRYRAIAARYAEAFVKYTRQNRGLKEVVSDLLELRRLLRDNPDFHSFLENPGIALADKASLIDKVVDGSLAGETRNFLKLLIDHGRIGHILDIIEYVRKKYAHAGEEDVLLKTSYPLDLDMVKRIQQSVAQRLQKKCRFYIELDSSLLGGVQVVVGNKVFDGSVRRRLEDLKEKLQTIPI